METGFFLLCNWGAGYNIEKKETCPMLQLIQMSDSDFTTYIKTAATDYAQEHIRSGNWHPDEALQRAEQEIRQLLPDGPRSENQYLYTLVDESTGQKVGMIWFAINPNRPQKIAFIYDFVIYEAFRRRGYGFQALQSAEQKARDLGAQRIELHVFAHNQAARLLYEKAGYQVTNLIMTKSLV
jgi:RimJ/RimL family protein N-acetyltransferase